MPITVSWLDEEKTIVLQVYTGRWTWDEFYQATQVTTAKMMKSTNQTVHIFADYTHSQGIPAGGAFTKAYSALRSYPDNWGSLVIVGANRFITMMVEIFKNMFRTSLGAKTFIAETMDDAYNLIAEYDTQTTEA